MRLTFTIIINVSSFKLSVLYQKKNPIIRTINNVCCNTGNKDDAVLVSVTKSGLSSTHLNTIVAANKSMAANH